MARFESWFPSQLRLKTVISLLGCRGNMALPHMTSHSTQVHTTPDLVHVIAQKTLPGYLLMFLDTGIRLREQARIMQRGVDIYANTIRVMGK